MPFWKKLLIDIIFIAIYYIFYKVIGFELTVIIALGQILSTILQKDYHKKSLPPPTSTYRFQQKGKVKF